jgi:hypothetical protein
MAPYLQAAEGMVRSGALLSAAEETIGPLD